MSRFILYSGVAHALAFVGAVTYLTTQPKENLPEFLRPSNAAIEAIEMTDATQPLSTDIQAAVNEGDPESKVEMRDRKMRASLPSPPESPRVLEKANGAKKLPTVLPAKKGSLSKAIENTDSVPEMAKDIVPMTEEASVVSEDIQETKMEKTESVVAMAATEEQSAEVDEEKLELAPFDVDEIANKHISQVKAFEELEAQKKAAALAAEKEAAMKALSNTDSSGTSDGSVDGSSRQSPSAPAPAPVAGENIKTLAEFKQKPGNRKPEFDLDDRRSGRNGMVVFLAYITKEGRPREFQLQASSGHRSLDAKTLKALKSWKFMPGQEGWVEIPFQWDLKGSEDSPATLRRSVSR